MRAILKRVIDRYVSLDGLPPRRLQLIVGGDYRSVGEEFCGYLQHDLGLRPHERVLDVGCGCGRIAMPLTKYLSAGGSYEGFDIAPPLVNWCRRRIARRHPNFRFRLADIHNPVFHPAGRHKPETYRFPWESDSFDCVFLTSVFTHMLRPGVERYMSEIVRVLKPGGRSLMTFFLLNDESRKLIHAGRSDPAFQHTHGDCLIDQPQAPEAAIAYPEGTVRRLHAVYGLKVIKPVLYGTWCGRESGRSYQDIVLAVKADNAGSHPWEAAEWPGLERTQ